MELLVPFMLLVLGISDDDPSDVQLVRHPVLFASEAECLKAGEEVVRARVIGEHESATNFRVFCKRVPKPKEFEDLFSELGDASDARRAESSE